MQSLHDRLGEPQWTELQGFDKAEHADSAWVRIVGKDIDSRSRDDNFSVSSNVWLIQAGGDIGQWNVFSENDRLHVGAMLAYGHGSSDASAYGNPATANSDLHGFIAGLYATWYQNDESKLGWYGDTWAQYGWLDNSVSRRLLPTVSYNSRVLGVSGEAGYAFYVRHQRDWILEPQAQLIYEHGEEDQVLEQNGTTVAGGHGTGWISRLGLRFHRTWTSSDGTTHFQPYLTLSWWHDASSSVLAFNQVSLRDLYPENRQEVKLGLNILRDRRWTAWTNAGWQFGNQSYHAFVGRIGVKYTW